MDIQLDEVRKILISDKTVERAIEESVLRNPEKMAKIIYPVIAPSIIISVKEFLEKLILSFNRSIESAFSKQGLIWRWEAFKSGKSYSDVVLIHSLLFRVEDILVIHKRTGILLVHSKNQMSQKKSIDQIAALLTAIKDFVDEALLPDSERKKHPLNSIKVGDYDLIIEETSQLLVAVALKGNATSGYRHRIYERLLTFQQKFSEEISHFSGNTSAFLEANKIFDDCLLEEMKDKRVPGKERKFHLHYMTIVIICLFLAWLIKVGFGMFQIYNDGKLFVDYVSKLEETPGIVLLNTEKKDKKDWKIRVLKERNLEVQLPRVPERLEKRVKVITRPYTSLSSSRLNTLERIKIPYWSESKELNGDPTDQFYAFKELVKTIDERSQTKEFYVHTFAFDDPNDQRLKLTLSKLIGRLETELAKGGMRRNRIIRYSILKPVEKIHTPLIHFEVVYD